MGLRNFAVDLVLLSLICGSLVLSNYRLSALIVEYEEHICSIISVFTQCNIINDMTLVYIYKI